MSLNIKQTLEFFKELNNEITTKYNNQIQIKFYILGGTFFLMKQLRKNSPDIDILASDNESYNILLQTGIPIAKKHKISLDLLSNKTLNTTILPENFHRLAKPYRKNRNNHPNLKIWTLSPYHILLSKIFRHKPKDISDINLIMTSGKFQIRKKRLLQEKRKYNYSSNTTEFENNFNNFLKEYNQYFKKTWFETLIEK